MKRLIMLHPFAIISFLSVSYYLWSSLPGMTSLLPSVAPFTHFHQLTWHRVHVAENPADQSAPNPVAAKVCETPECVHAASEILYNLDPNHAKIDPCTDFDQYVCGGWRERHDMRPDQGSIFAGTYMSETAQSQLRHILESPEASDPADSKNFDKLKAAYGACMDESIVNKRGVKPLQDLLSGLDNVYSLASTSKGSDVNITDAFLYLIGSGVEALVSPLIMVFSNRS